MAINGVSQLPQSNQQAQMPNKLAQTTNNFSQLQSQVSRDPKNVRIKNQANLSDERASNRLDRVAQTATTNYNNQAKALNQDPTKSTWQSSTTPRALSTSNAVAQ